MDDKSKKLLTGYILPAVAVPIGGFILLNLTFMLDAAYQALLNLFMKPDYNSTNWLQPAVRHVSFAVIILVISLFVFRAKKLKDIYKAVFTAVPMATVLVIFGIIFNKTPAVVYTLGAVIYGAVILYLIKSKKQWFYYYAISLTALVLLIMMISGVDI